MAPEQRQSDARAPRHLLLVVHVEQHSGPMRSFPPRLAELRDRGTKITTLLPRHGPAADVAAELGEVLTGGPEAGSLPRGPGSLLDSLQAIRAHSERVNQVAVELDCELVLITGSLLPGAMAGARRSGAGVVVNAAEPPPLGRRARIATRALAKLTHRLADRVLVPSQRSAERQRAFGLEPVVVTPAVEFDQPPGELAARAIALRESHGLGTDDRVVASLGAISHRRGQDLLVSALAEAKAAGSHWKLLIGGEAFLHADDRAYAAGLHDQARGLGVADRVVIAGAVGDVAAFHAAADVFVNPARIEESFGRAACEAMLVGTPVIATSPTTSAARILEHERTALVVPRDDPEALDSAIERLLRNPDLGARLAEAGAWEVVMRCTLAGSQPTFESAVFDATAAGRQRRGQRV